MVNRYLDCYVSLATVFLFSIYYYDTNMFYRHFSKVVFYCVFCIGEGAGAATSASGGTAAQHFRGHCYGAVHAGETGGSQICEGRGRRI